MTFQFKNHYLFFVHRLSNDLNDPENREPPVNAQMGIEHQDDSDADPGQEENQADEQETMHMLHYHVDRKS